MMDWIADTWQGFVDWIFEVLKVIFTFVKDVFLDVFELVLQGVVFIYESITPPDFLSQGIGVLFSSLHPDIVYFLSQSGLDAGLAVYGAGVSFRLLRKLFTLGQWQMIIFHEGLPGSGKSYETLISHIIPSMSKGRKVFARINGLNHEKIAELSNITVEECKALLIPIEEEQVADIHNHVENDSMVIIDELQNFFPTGRGKLSEGITQFVTEHRHRGIDIVTMGQSLADVHNLWRRRTQRKIQFLKLDMVGQENRYKWTAFQGALNGKGEITFTKVKSGSRKYDKKYFGSYASHQADTTNTENYGDDRLNIFKTKTFTVVIPIFIICVIFAINYLVGFFSGKEKITEQAPQEVTQTEQSATGQQRTEARAAAKTETKQRPNEHGFDFLRDINEQYESKITYLDERRGIVWDMIIVWYDNTGKVMDRLTHSDFRAMGYRVTYEGYGVKVEKKDYKALYRFKPRWEPAYSISQQHREQLNTES